MRAPKERGFTLIELLIVVVIIGILAVIAIPRFADTKKSTYVAAMKSDVRNLAVAQESHFYDLGTYSLSLIALNVRPTTGVTLLIPEATGGGWSVESRHVILEGSATPVRCYLFIGTAAPLGLATAEGIITCG